MADGIRYLCLFSGMGSSHVALAPLGWQCVGVSEIDPNACATLRHRLPDVPNLGDVAAITAEQIAALGRIDVVIGGSPCQDLSVAGKRAGLAGERSGLFHEQLRIFDAARTFCGARWLVWENVPGAFSSNAGRDFAVVVGAMAGCQLDVPADGWGSEGVALGRNGLVEWAVLDSQWFGVAQRRRLVFAVLDTGDWSNRPPVLLEPDRLRGDSAPSRSKGPGTTVGTLGGTSPGGGWRIGADEAAAGQLIPVIGAMAHGQGGAEITEGERSPTLTCNHEAPILIQAVTGTLQANGTAAGSATTQDAAAGLLIPEVSHTLRADGFDASEDGTGRGTPLVPCIAFDCKASGQAGFGVGEIASTMRSMGHADSHQNGGGHLAVAVGCDTYNDSITGDVAATLSTQSGDGVSAGPSVLTAMQVRRLTPRECERLQSAPDDWTLVPNDKGKPMADGPRYKQCGNAYTANVIRWIGRQIEAAHRVTEPPPTP